RIGGRFAGNFPAGSLEKFQCLKLMLAIIAFLGVDGILPFGGEDFRWHLRFDAIQNFELASFWQPLRLQIRVLEETADPLIEIEEQLFVGLFEIEEEVESVPDAHVLELFAAQIENKSLHRSDAFYWDRLFDHEPLFQRIEIILRRPGGSPVLDP